MNKMMTRGEFLRENNMLMDPMEYRAKEKVKDYEFVKAMGPILGGLLGLGFAISLWIDADYEYLGVANKVFLGALMILIGVGIGFLILLPLAALVAHILEKAHARRIDRKCDEYNKKYNEVLKRYSEYKNYYNRQVEQEGLEYANSKLVQRAADQITAFFFRKGIRPEKRPTDQKTVSSSITFSVARDVIRCGCNDRSMRDIEPEKLERYKVEVPEIYKAYLDQFETLVLRFTGDGWRFEEIRDESMMEAVAEAIGAAVKTRVLKQAAELSTEKDPRCQWYRTEKDSSCWWQDNGENITVDYSAGNSRFMPAQKI